MKKKIIVSISTVLVLVVCAVALIACGAPSTLTKFVSKASTSNSLTVEGYDSEGNVAIKIERKNKKTHTQNFDALGTVIYEAYDLIENEKSVTYVKVTSKEMKSKVETILESLINSNIAVGATPVEINLTLDNWSRFEVGEAPDYTEDSVFRMLPLSILSYSECPKCVGKKVIEDRFNEKYIENNGKWYLKTDYENSDKEHNYFTFEDGTLNLFEKSIKSKFIKTASYKLSANNVKLPADASKLKK